MDLRPADIEGARGIYILHADPSLNDRDATASLDAVESILDAARLLVLDCTDLHDITSAGVGNIMRLKARLALRGNALLRLAALQPRVEAVLLKARADHVVEIFPDVHAATTRRVPPRP